MQSVICQCKIHVGFKRCVYNKQISYHANLGDRHLREIKFAWNLLVQRVNKGCFCFQHLDLDSFRRCPGFETAQMQVLQEAPTGNLGMAIPGSLNTGTLSSGLPPASNCLLASYIQQLLARLELFPQRGEKKSGYVISDKGLAHRNGGRHKGISNCLAWAPSSSISPGACVCTNYFCAEGPAQHFALSGTDFFFYFVRWVTG